MEFTQPDTFNDPELETLFRRDGFVVVDLFDNRTVDELLAVYQRLDSGIDEGFYPSLKSSDVDYKNATHREVTRLVWPRLSQLLDGYEEHLGVFMVKHPGPESDCPIHQDWIIADESKRPSMTSWMPLTHVGDAEGVMRVLPGSHRWLDALRGSPMFPTPWDGHVDEVRDELMVPVSVDPGQAMIYDVRLLHGSPPNLSSDVRVAASMYAVPAGATRLHYHRDESGTVRGFQVPSNFCTVFQIGELPEGEEFVAIPDYSLRFYSVEEMKEIYRSSPAGIARQTVAR